MRIVFMGSPAFALPSLRALLQSGHDVAGVVTQPDRPAGRGRVWTPPPVKVLALERGLTVLQPVNVSSPPSVERLRALEPDVLIIAAYGQILRERVLALPARGALNVHASLLPRHRGASPVAAAILAGDEVTGVTIMEVVRALDAGPMVASVEEPVLPLDTTGTLEARLADSGAQLLGTVLDDWAQGRRRPQPQDDSLATYAPMVRRRDALMDWTQPAVNLWRRVRAFNPWPVAYTFFRGTEVRVWEAWPLAGDSGSPPGTVLPAEGLPDDAPRRARTFSVQTGAGRLALLLVQRTGRRAMAGADFLRGWRDIEGATLGE